MPKVPRRDSKLWEAAVKAAEISKGPVVRNTETMVLQSELSQLTANIRELIKRKKQVQRLLKEAGVKPIGKDYLSKPIYLYALKLEGGYWYVGMTRNVDKRFGRHQKGKGAGWTKMHRPIEVAESRCTGLTDDAEAALLEDEMTLDYARMYGHHLVRGGGYCQRKPRWPDSLLS